jgi:hypothetical protein
MHSIYQYRNVFFNANWVWYLIVSFDPFVDISPEIIQFYTKVWIIYIYSISYLFYTCVCFLWFFYQSGNPFFYFCFVICFACLLSYVYFSCCSLCYIHEHWGCWGELVPVFRMTRTCIRFHEIYELTDTTDFVYKTTLFFYFILCDVYCKAETDKRLTARISM